MRAYLSKGSLKAFDMTEQQKSFYLGESSNNLIGSKNIMTQNDFENSDTIQQGLWYDDLIQYMGESFSLSFPWNQKELKYYST